MKYSILNVGFGNGLMLHRIVSILNPDSSPMKRLKDEARENGKLIDATFGRKTRSILITDSDHVVLSALQPETLFNRLTEGGEYVE
ncbi:MAG: DUF370 domain-containing protein [Candidatus Wallbacteria bacterium]|nr:DUF370 domain-containing protein [Candidatus Wallbacteria bacterium]